MKVPRKKTGKKHSVDRMMRNVSLSLIRDFQTSLEDPLFCCELQDALRIGAVEEIRSASSTAPCADDEIARYKALYQMQSILKRYRFQTDIYSDKELEEKAVKGFTDTQSRLADVDLDSLPAYTQTVLDRAAEYIARILGVYSDEEHRSLCRFGSKASVGIPLRKACESERWQLPITGSCEQISWFDSEMSQVDSVQEYWLDQLYNDPSGSVYQETSSLKLTLVPKTFKSLRSIMPNTTIGSYMSHGLGEMIRKRLKREGYDIRTLQQRHRNLACSASVHELHVTADLSSASDSITVALVKRLFPSDWLKILEQSRIGTVVLPNNQSVESLTFCTMGIGYTFPLQTLVFLSLLKAIEATMFSRLDRRTISVYGDDMIYHHRMHDRVLHVFEQIGFVVNVEKTFAAGPFRESCGGDYYRGVDVRPFQPRNGSVNVSDKAYEAILYKYVNGLLARWSEYEIGWTLRYLTSEIESVVGKIKLVPHDFPDESGVKVSGLALADFLKGAKCALPKHLGSGVFRFSYLRFVPDERKEERHGPLLWASLRGGALSAISYADGLRLQDPPAHLAAFINEVVDVREKHCPLKVKEDKPVAYVRSNLTGIRLRRVSTWITVSGSGRYTRQSGTSCFEARR